MSLANANRTVERGRGRPVRDPRGMRVAAVPISLRLPVDVDADVRAQAARTGVPVSQLIADIITAISRNSRHDH